MLLTELAQKRVSQTKWLKFQDYKIQLNTFYNENESNNKSNLFFYAKPQISLYQTPFLEFFELFREIMRRRHDRDTILNLLHEQFQPLINPHWLPMTKQLLPQRGKFSQLDDNLLLLGLKKFGSNVQNIQKFFLRYKKLSEIKHRLKNLVCSRAPDNLIKRWKILQFLPLSPVVFFYYY